VPRGAIGRESGESMPRERFVFCVACGRPVSPPRAALLVECDCGKEYRGLTDQPVDEPICGLTPAAGPPSLS
jgi:hypothetical protein